MPLFCYKLPQVTGIATGFDSQQDCPDEYWSCRMIKNLVAVKHLIKVINCS